MIVNPSMQGKSLPELTSPGTASDLAEGKQLIDENGEIVEGTASLDTTINYIEVNNMSSSSVMFISGSLRETVPSSQSKTIDYVGPFSNLFTTLVLSGSFSMTALAIVGGGQSVHLKIDVA